jgi:peptide/nickel transport system permease protein
VIFRPSILKRAVRKKTVWFSLSVILFFGLVALLAPWIAPHDPYKWELYEGYLPPAWVQNTAIRGSTEYLLGTDYFGRDILSRIIYGTRTAFFLALVAVPFAALIGTLVGLVSGYARGKLDGAITLFTETIQSLPGVMFMVIIILIFRNHLAPTWINGSLTLVIGYAAVAWVNLARLVRINVLQIKSKLFIEAAISIGATPSRIVFKHILPNVLHVVLVWMINNIPAVILLEVLLGYIGVGITSAIQGGEFDVVSWGGMFFAGRKSLMRNPLMIVIPSLCILLLTMSCVLLADFINEATTDSED